MSSDQTALDGVVTGAKWRFFVCWRGGPKIATLGKVAKDRKLQFRANKPDVFQFRVPSDSDECLTELGDGYPLISKQRRTVKGYRLEGGAYVIRFAGIVWQLQDKGEGENAFTTVTVYSPYVMLSKMPAIPAGTAPGTVYHIAFSGLDIGDFVVTLVDNANTAAGF